MSQGIDNFMAELAKLPAKGYKVEQEGEILRLRPPDGGQLLCPILAVYHAQTGCSRRNSEYWLLAQAIGLSGTEGDDIADAADGDRPILRRRILKALES